jgi:hypothetical protein
MRRELVQRRQSSHGDGQIHLRNETPLIRFTPHHSYQQGEKQMRKPLLWMAAGAALILTTSAAFAETMTSPPKAEGTTTSSKTMASSLSNGSEPVTRIGVEELTTL